MLSEAKHLGPSRQMLRFAQHDTGRQLRLRPIGRPQGSPLPRHDVDSPISDCWQNHVSTVQLNNSGI